MTTKPRSISVIAREILRDWKKPYYGAVPYIDAMLSLDSVYDTYIAESAKSIILYFLSNASAWRGAKAKEIKAELKAMIK